MGLPAGVRRGDYQIVGPRAPRSPPEPPGVSQSPPESSWIDQAALRLPASIDLYLTDLATTGRGWDRAGVWVYVCRPVYVCGCMTPLNAGCPKSDGCCVGWMYCTLTALVTGRREREAVNCSSMRCTVKDPAQAHTHML